MPRLRAFLRSVHRIVEEASNAVSERQLQLQRLNDELTQTRNKLDDLSAKIYALVTQPKLLAFYLGEDGERLIRELRVASEKQKIRESRISQQRAKASAGRLEFRWLETGKCQVEIDFSTVEMPGKLAKLLEVLSTEQGVPEKDGLPSFKSRQFLLEKLNEENEFPAVTVAHLNNHIWRLREYLEKKGLSCDLVESVRGRGLRFRLKRPGSGCSVRA